MHLQTAFERVLFTSGTDHYHMYRIPGILPVEGGLLIALEARAENKGDWGNIDISVYLISGESMTEVVKIGNAHALEVDRMETYNNPTLIPDGDRVHLLYHLNYERAFQMTSPDGGKTWGEAREITQFYKESEYRWNVCATGPGHGIKTRSGRLIAPVWLAMGEEFGAIRVHRPSVCAMLYSDDGGEIWHMGKPCEGLVNASETGVCERTDGTLFINIRNESEGHRRASAYSDDGGQTIRDVFFHPDLPDPVCFGSIAEKDGVIWFVNCESEKARENLTVKRSTDGGKTFKSVWHADACGGYADLAVTENSIYLFYERIHPTTGKFELVLKRADFENALAK